MSKKVSINMQFLSASEGSLGPYYDNIMEASTAWKVPNTEFFWSLFFRICTEYGRNFLAQWRDQNLDF